MHLKKNKFFLPILSTILFFIVGFCVFQNSLHGKFIWDDEAQIVNNIKLRSLKNIPLFFTGSTFYIQNSQNSLEGMYYRPVMTTSYSIIYHFSGLNSVVYHVVQLSIHCLNSILLFWLFLKLIRWKNKVLPMLLCLLFLVHPMNSEVVSYIANMQDVLFFFFGISALLVVVLPNQMLPKVIVSACLFALSIFSKETGFLFFPLIIGYLFLFRKPGLKRLAISYFLVSVGYIYIRCGVAHICHGNSGPNPISRLPFLKYLLQMPAMLFYYIKTFFFPKNVAIGQHWWVKTPNFADFIFPLIVVFFFFLTLAIIYLYLNYKSVSNSKYKRITSVYTFFFLWLVLGLIMHIHIMPLDFTVADRWFYFSMPGILGLLGCILLLFPKKIGTIFYLLFISILLLLSVLTRYRNADFQDPFKLYLHDNLVTSDSYDLENNIGVELFRRGLNKQAQKHFMKTVKIVPYWQIGLVNLGVTYEKEGKYAEAEKYYFQAVKNNKYYDAYNSYVRVLIIQHKYDVAKEFLISEALNAFPHDKVLTKYLDQLK